jgi:hypothetical protein
MDEKKIEKLLELISELVSGSGTWKEKRDSVLDEASSEDKTNLEEFASWYDTE